MGHKKLREPGIAIRKILATNVRALRHELGISQEELAHISGLHRTYIGSVERSERNVTLSTLDALSEALNVTVPDLLTPQREK